jgi:acetyl-CoA carboxylase biotin carboxyl carrier protein
LFALTGGGSIKDPGFHAKGRTMKIEEIRELIRLMKDNQIGEIDVQAEGERIRLKALQPGGPVGYAYPALPAPVTPQQHSVELVGHPPVAGSPPPAAAEQAETGEVITSPIVGIFYAAPSPDKPPFVQVGDPVEESSVVCVIEAMKVMNEIKAELRGTVRKVYVENGQPVEYGQPLFLVEPTG